MDPKGLEPGKLFEIMLNAFPADEDAIQFEHVDSTMRSTFRVCRLCGALILDSMTATHINEIHVRNANFN